MPSTQSTVELGNTSEYQQKLLSLLGNRDPIDVLSASPDIFARIVKDNPPEKMRTRPFPGKWTPNEIIGHLTDSEWVYGFRVRHILCENEPTLISMDQDLWVSGQNHNDREPFELVEMFRHLRQYNLFNWRRMSAADHARIGRHVERGAETLGLMLKMNAGHDLSHVDQITRYLAAIR